MSKKEFSLIGNSFSSWTKSMASRAESIEFSNEYFPFQKHRTRASCFQIDNLLNPSCGFEDSYYDNANSLPSKRPRQAMSSPRTIKQIPRKSPPSTSSPPIETAPAPKRKFPSSTNTIVRSDSNSLPTPTAKSSPNSTACQQVSISPPAIPTSAPTPTHSTQSAFAAKLKQQIRKAMATSSQGSSSSSTLTSSQLHSMPGLSSNLSGGGSTSSNFISHIPETSFITSASSAGTSSAPRPFMATGEVLVSSAAPNTDNTSGNAIRAKKGSTATGPNINNQQTTSCLNSNTSNSIAASMTSTTKQSPIFASTSLSLCSTSQHPNNNSSEPPTAFAISSPPTSGNLITSSTVSRPDNHLNTTMNAVNNINNQSSNNSTTALPSSIDSKGPRVHETGSGHSTASMASRVVVGIRPSNCNSTVSASSEGVNAASVSASASTAPSAAGYISRRVTTETSVAAVGEEDEGVEDDHSNVDSGADKSCKNTYDTKQLQQQFGIENHHYQQPHNHNLGNSNIKTGPNGNTISSFMASASQQISHQLKQASAAAAAANMSSSNSGASIPSNLIGGLGNSSSSSKRIYSTGKTRVVGGRTIMVRNRGLQSRSLVHHQQQQQQQQQHSSQLFHQSSLNNPAINNASGGNKFDPIMTSHMPSGPQLLYALAVGQFPFSSPFASPVASPIAHGNAPGTPKGNSHHQQTNPFMMPSPLMMASSSASGGILSPLAACGSPTTGGVGQGLVPPFPSMAAIAAAMGTATTANSPVVLQQNSSSSPA